LGWAWSEICQICEQMAEGELQFLRHTFLHQTNQLMNNFFALERGIQTNENMEQTLSAVRELLGCFQKNVHEMVKNPFEKLPNELVVHVFIFVQSAKDLDTLSQVCRLFHSLLQSNSLPWKKLCFNWWSKQELNKEFQLEKDIFQECYELDPIKDWKWLGRCISRQNALNGLSCVRLTDSRGNLTEIEVGQMRNGVLNGFGFTLFYDMKCIGTFRDGKQHDGISILSGVEKYIGEYSLETGHFDGIGSYTSLDKGWTYKGNLNESKFHGKGVMTWPNGFYYDGLWFNGEPIDKIGCLSPALKQCIDNGLCTSLVTGISQSYGQFLGTTEHREQLFCETCAKRCCQTGLSTPLWYSAGCCSCAQTPLLCHAKSSVTAI